MIGLIGPLLSIGKQYLKGKQELHLAQSKAKLVQVEAKAEISRKVAAGELEWNNTMAEASNNSWKDEWLTILVSIPLILAFAGKEDVVTRGFEALELMPDFYKTAVGVVFAASFGVQQLTKMFKK
jgi:hypothetical protein